MTPDQSLIPVQNDVLDPAPAPSRPPGDLVPATGVPLDQNPAAVYLGGLSAGSRRAMADALGKVADILFPDRWSKPARPRKPRPPGRHASKEAKRAYKRDLAAWTEAMVVYRAQNERYLARCLAVPWDRLRFQHTAAIRSTLDEAYSPAYTNKALSALRGALKAAWRLGQMSSDDYRRAVDLEPVSGKRLPAGRHVESGELVALSQACQADQGPAGVRDGAMIALLYCGLRREEVVALDLADCDLEAGRLLVRGKGDKERFVPLVGGADDALADWLAVRGREPGPLFVQIARGGNIQAGERLTPQAVYYLLGKRRGEAEIDKSLSPHDLRRSLISDLLDAGVDLVTVQRIVGHSDPKTTARYDRRGERAKKQAAGRVHFPWRRRGWRGDGKSV